MPALKTHPKPVDGTAARAAFYRGCHFEAPQRGGQRTHTWRYPPVTIGEMPEGVADFTGLRYGRMVVLYWYRPGKGRNPCVWIARCACGNYEARVPERWAEFCPPAWRGNDACEFCKDADVALGRLQAKNSKAAKRHQWAAQLFERGLSVEEVAGILQHGISVSGLSVAEIRVALNAAREAHA